MPDKPAHVPDASVRPIPPMGFGRTQILCPVCGHRTGLTMRFGDVTVYCFRCHTSTRVVIEVVRLAETCEGSSRPSHQAPRSPPSGCKHTALMCPEGGHWTGAWVCTGDVCVPCQECGILVKVMIQVINKELENPEARAG
jgi:hypothetical protein